MKANLIFKLIIAICFFQISVNVFGQYEFYYAKSKSNDFINSSNIDEIKKQANDSLNSKIKNSIIKNYNNEATKSTEYSDILGNIINPTLSQTELIKAITEIMLNKGKEEVFLAFFDRMATKFEDTIKIDLNNGDSIKIYLKDIFPCTYLQIKSIRDNFNLQLGKSFQDALEMDMKNLFSNITKNELNKKLSQLDEYKFIKKLIFISEEMRKQNNPFNILQLLRTEVNDKSTINESVFNIAAAVYESLINPETGSLYKKEKLVLLGVEFENYLFLLLSNPENAKSFKKLGLDINSDKNNPLQKFMVRNKIKVIINQIYVIKSKIDFINKIDYSYEYENGNTIKKDSVSAKPEIYLFEEIISLYSNVYDLYSNDTNGYTDFAKVSSKDTLLQIAQKFIYYHNAAKQKDYGKMTIAILQLLDEFIKTEELPKEFIKYLTLISEVSNSKNSDEAKKIMEAAILPAGSWRITRESSVNVSLNGYLGGFCGEESIYKLKNSNKTTTVGIFAPVGLSIGLGNIRCDERKNEGGKSFSIFISAIDLGTLLSYRLNADSSSFAPNFQFKNIVSPGLFFVWGFGKTPVTMGLGWQIGPVLRDISAKDINMNGDYYSRFSFFIALDLPFINFYTKPKN